MANDQQLFLGAEISPDECPQTPQEWVNLVARSLIPNPDFVNPDVGQKDGIIMGGPQPTSDEGPWIPEGETELWFYDPVFAGYYPGGEKAGTMKAIAQKDNSPGNNWLPCNGTAIPQVQYPRLFAAIGHYFARPDGDGRTGGQSGADASALEASGQFRLPDTTGAVIIGVGPLRNWPDEHVAPMGPFVLGDKVGNFHYTLTPNNLRNVNGYGIGYQFDNSDSPEDHSPDSRFYCGPNYKLAQPDYPARPENEPFTAAGDYFEMTQPSLAVAFYIRF